jgi:hypothetical protein
VSASMPLDDELRGEAYTLTAGLTIPL